jgi:hypothetical protein
MRVVFVNEYHIVSYHIISGAFIMATASDYYLRANFYHAVCTVHGLLSWRTAKRDCDTDRTQFLLRTASLK